MGKEMQELEDEGEPRNTHVAVAWLTFTATVVAASAVDLVFISRKRGSRAKARQGATRAPGEDADAAGDLGETDTGDVATSMEATNVAFCRQIFFWLVVSSFFNLFVWNWFGPKAGASWAYGYVVEYLLSVDNLFVFRMVFQTYFTPQSQVGRALFWGVAAAVILRLIFFCVGTRLLQLGFAVRCFFGGALIYSGIKTVRDSDGGDDDPKDNMCIKMITKLLPLHDGYSTDASFFINVGPDTPGEGDGDRPLPTVFRNPGGDANNVDANGFLEDHYATCAERALALNETAKESVGEFVHEAVKDEATSDANAAVGQNGLDGGCRSPEKGLPHLRISDELLRTGSAPSAATAEATSSSDMPPPQSCGGNVEEDSPRRKVTLLLLVVVSLSIIDVIFAVDSVTAKISSIADLGPKLNIFVNLTSTAFAMFVLRSLYFLLDMVVRIFRFLNYGVGTVLVAIGMKLILSGVVEVGMIESCAAIVAILMVSLVASCVLPEKPEDDAEPTEPAQMVGIGVGDNPCSEGNV
mmetsp:Transcript_11573/g.30956  ORF Transcript_11573/g.30956 Transcript_11573/m.30956 type:complete len:524 (+) Transcript_11573:98-1669(+)|eukprot:CAMPEP_0117464370 /NCGR_PEP_ID=MMETSP0784-20121206/4066_1 /TAXON_ID=39447 /ORGANISM="" /LENGTH=523 /DNA_ID=CAMNT_0005258227 /DNA_START=12 /DNA_END=1583 /DNA_ORIENTATION=-